MRNFIKSDFGTSFKSTDSCFYRSLETLDTAFYECQASNGIDTIASTAIIKVKMGALDPSRRPAIPFNDDDYDEVGLLPETYSEPDFRGKVEFIDTAPFAGLLLDQNETCPRRPDFVMKKTNT